MSGQHDHSAIPELSLSYVKPILRKAPVTFVVTCAIILSNGIPVQGGPLYQCRDASGVMTFTDNTAQLGPCIPLQSSPVQTTGAGPSIPSYPAHYATPPFSEQVTDFPMESPPSPGITLPSHNLNRVGMSPELRTTFFSPTSGAQPCHPEFNPLNPLSAPPCQVREPSQATTQAPPFPSDIQPPTP